MKGFFGFHTVKVVLALLGADWGFQTTAQAMKKGRCWRHRLRHVAMVAALQGLSAGTARVSWPAWLLFVVINGVSHFVIDSLRLAKPVDQGLHVAVAVMTAPLVKEGRLAGVIKKGVQP